MIDALSLIQNIGGEVVVFSRRAVGSYVNGVWVPGALSTVTATVSIQPASARDRQILPEGDRTRETVRVYSPVELKTTLEGSSAQAPDEFTWQGRLYRVKSVERWIGDFWKAIAVAVNAAGQQ